MKKTVLVLLLVLCGTGMLCAQNVLPGYRGYWEKTRRVDIFDLIEFYPDQLPFLRNEIYARYGRPFVNKTYQDYFRAKNWYREKSDFSESWLTPRDRENAALILSVENSIRNIDEITAQVIKNIMYTGKNAILTFTSRQELMWSDPEVDFGPYGISGYNAQTMKWLVMGDWILVYKYNNHQDSYAVTGYKLDHGSQTITASASREGVDAEVLQVLLHSQGRPISR